MSRLRWTGMGTAVLLLAAAFRLIDLHNVPPGLSQDEVFNAGMVPFILEGNHAIFFREAFGHEPLYHYWTIPFQLLLGDHWLAARLPAVVLGMLLVALLLAWGRREFGEGATIIAAVFVAISWWPIVFSRIGLRPIMLPLFLLLFAWCWPKRPLWAGVWLGLSFYTYTAARVIFLIPALTFLWALVLESRHSPWRWGDFWAVGGAGRNLRFQNNAQFGTRYTAVWVLLISLLIFAPLGITLWLDPSLQTRVADLSGPLDALQAGEWGPILETTRLTLGVFSFTGDPRWTYSLPDRPLFAPLTAVFFWVGFAVALLRWREARFWLLLIWLGVGLLPSAITPDAPSTVRIVGAIPPTFMILSFGFVVVWEFLTDEPLLKKGRVFGQPTSEDDTSDSERFISEMYHIPTSWTRFGSPYFYTASVTFYALMLVMLFAFWNGWRTVRDGFIEYPRTAEGRDKYQTIWQEVGANWAVNGGSLVVADAFFEQLDDDTLRRNLGYSPEARWQQTGGLVLPVEGNGRLYVPEYAPVPDDLQEALKLTFLERSLRSPRFTVYALPETRPALETEVSLEFGDGLILVGYEILPPVGENQLRIITAWRAKKRLPPDLSFFIHLLENDEILAQHDGLDVVGSTLQSGDQFLQLHVIPTIDWSANEQDLRLGVYRRSDSVRLRLPNGDDSIMLQP